MDHVSLATIVTSAAVGALASALVNLLGQAFERRARRRELLLAKAIELAFARRDTLLKVVERTGQGFSLRDDVAIAADYFAELRHLLDTGRLSSSFREREAKSKADNSSTHSKS
jgi:hypothetical protein